MRIIGPAGVNSTRTLNLVFVYGGVQTPEVFLSIG